MTWMDIPLIIADEGKTIRNKLTDQTARLMPVLPDFQESDFEEIDDISGQS